MELKKYKLGEIAYFVEDKISSNEISLNEYITTDCLLQNKKGRTIATNLPPQSCSLTKFQKEDILIGNIRPYLKKIWFADIDGGCSLDVLVLRSRNKNESTYLFSILMQDSFFDFVMKATKGSKMPRGDKNHILNFLCFDISNKIKIGNFIKSLDDKIALNRRINAELEAMAKELYDYYFVQFDFPNADGKPYKSSGGKMVYSDVLKREIPEGWEVKKLGEILELLKDGTHNPPKRVENGIALLTGTMFGDNFLDFSKATYITEEDYKSIHSQYAPQEGDVIITKIGTLGNVNYLSKFDIPIAIHCNSALLRFPKTFGLFGFYYCKSDLFKMRLRAVKGQSIQEFVSLNRIESIFMEIPPKEIISAFNEKAQPIFDYQLSLEQETQQLTALRDELLPLLMNGQVEVR